jgi:two-component system, OmpR family, copper resistance phosphate regulon response regulator CusR
MQLQAQGLIFTNMKLLVVEDEVKTANTLKKGFEENGFQVVTAFDGEQAFNLCTRQRFDVIISDIIVPRLNGMEFCRNLRAAGNDTPIIMLTALGLTADKIRGFEAGTDDYMVKPFDFSELLARVKAVITRSRKNQPAEAKESSLQFKDLTLNLDTKEASRSGRKIPLTAKEYALLEYFMRNPNKIVSKDEIAEKVWDIRFNTGTNIIEVYVSYLRNKIDRDSPEKLIHTRKGMGYIFRTED